MEETLIDVQRDFEEEMEMKEEKCEFFVGDFEDDVEVIEVKLEDDEMENMLYDVSDVGNSLVDIANIPINDDVTPELIVPDDISSLRNSLKEKTLDNQELAILEKDLKTTTPGYEHLVDSNRLKVERTATDGEPTKLGDKNVDNNSKKAATTTEVIDQKLVDEKREKRLRHRLRICHLCGKNYTTDSGFRHHMVMHRDPSYSCHLCGRVFWEYQNLKKHLAALHSDDRPFQCHMCGMKYKRRDVLQEHIKRIHDGIKKTWNEKYLRKRRGSPSNPGVVTRFQCPHCNKCLASKAYLQDHINGAHIKKPLYKCDQCDMSFTRKASFRYHYNRAHVLKKKVLEPRGTFVKDCEYCGLLFQVKKYYDIHVAAKHFNKYPCQNCSDVFENKAQLMLHLETVHADEVAKCQFCQKTFIEDVHLKRHIYLVHTERKPYECHECGHKANKKSTLAVHMRRHTGEKPYQCEWCSKRFSQSVDFRKHRANHFKQRNEDQAEERVVPAKKSDDCLVETQEIGYSIECIDEKGKTCYKTIHEVFLEEE